MSYDKTIWTESTAVTVARLQKQEDGIADIEAFINTAIAQAEQNVLEAKLPIVNAIKSTNNKLNAQIANTWPQLAAFIQGLKGFETGTTMVTRTGADYILRLENLGFTPSAVIATAINENQNGFIFNNKNYYFTVTQFGGFPNSKAAVIFPNGCELLTWTDQTGNPPYILNYTWIAIK